VLFVHPIRLDLTVAVEVIALMVAPRK